MAGNAAMGSVSILHHITVGMTLKQNVEGHSSRTDSTEFVHARAAVHKIVATLNPNPYGPVPIEAHHAGSIWLYDGTNWRLVLNWAGIEWSAQFCADPAKVDALRQNAEAITAAFPETIPELTRLRYPDVDLLTTPVTDNEGIARYVDSIWNSCVPIPKSGHTGSVKAGSPLAAGVHNYPEAVCAIPRFMHDDFIPFVVDTATGTVSAVAPVAGRGEGDPRVRVLFAEKGHPLAGLKAEASREGAALVLGADNPITQVAFSQQ
jgi:hypothetical protein